MLHTCHFTLQTSKIGLSGTQDLHGKMNPNLTDLFSDPFVQNLQEPVYNKPEELGS